jgi:hypothetical protein
MTFILLIKKHKKGEKLCFNNLSPQIACMGGVNTAAY